MYAFEYYTYEDYKEWEGDWELIDGIAYAMTPSLVKNHQYLLSIITFLFQKELWQCPKCKVLVEMDYKVDEETILKPDLSILCKEDKEEKFISIAPDLIVEIISPKTARRDEKIKFEIYEKENVKYYILIYPNEKKAKVYINKDGFKKIGDFREENFEFDLNGCKAQINFKELFERI